MGERCTHLTPLLILPDLPVAAKGRVKPFSPELLTALGVLVSSTVSFTPRSDEAYAAARSIESSIDEYKAASVASGKQTASADTDKVNEARYAVLRLRHQEWKGGKLRDLPAE